jgi:hypothetical protein
MQPTSQKLDVIDSCLQKMLDCFPQKGRLTVQEIDDWHRDLSPFSAEAINFAFDSHRRNALFFPVAGQILDLCISYDPPDQRSTVTCDAACKAQHFKGYQWSDIRYLWKRVVGEEPFHFNNTNPRISKVLVQARALAGEYARSVVIERSRGAPAVIDWNYMLDELDRARGAAPEFRKHGESIF